MREDKHIAPLHPDGPRGHGPRPAQDEVDFGPNGDERMYDLMHRDSFRLSGRDYYRPGAYFVTIRTREFEQPFGEV